MTSNLFIVIGSREYGRINPGLMETAKKKHEICELETEIQKLNELANNLSDRSIMYDVRARILNLECDFNLKCVQHIRRHVEAFFDGTTLAKERELSDTLIVYYNNAADVMLQEYLTIREEIRKLTVAKVTLKHELEDGRR